MSEHTPLPWTADVESDHGDFVIWGPPPDGKFIANIGSDFVLPVEGKVIAFDIEKANAELIVAAVNERAQLQASLSRYETAMNDAYNVLQAPTDYAKDDGQVFADRKVRLEHASAILKDGLAGILRSNRATPAEEPGESKLEAVRKLADSLLVGEASSMSLSLARKQNDIVRQFLAILDAQPSTPEEGKET